MKFPFFNFGAAEAAAVEAIPPHMSIEMISSGIRLAPSGPAGPPMSNPEAESSDYTRQRRLRVSGGERKPINS